MNLLFLTLLKIPSIDERGIYTDLLREFKKNGHSITVVFPLERRFKQKTSFYNKEGVTYLGVKTLNIQKTNIIEKGLGTVLLEYQYNYAIKRYLRNIHFDLIVYSTPPITFTTVIRDLKKLNNKANTYLLLKDIFPQNAVEMGMLSEKSVLYKFFRRKEISLYKMSNVIGCMSPANVNYILEHNPYLSPDKVEVCPNSIEPNESRENVNGQTLRIKYNIPEGKKLAIYGGNLGKPQGIHFLLDVIDSNKNNHNLHFLIIGSGTEFKRIKNWFINNHPNNATLIPSLPKEEFDQIITIADIGLIFLDPIFTIPNFPSRLLSYLENKIPVIAATDSNTDLGSTLLEGNMGFWCISGDLDKFNDYLNTLLQDDNRRQIMGKNGYTYLLRNYTSKHSYEIIIKHFN